MAVFKCKMCGGSLEVGEQSVVFCGYCGTQQTLPKFDDERKSTLFTRANHLRFNCEFDKASGIYESIVAEYPDEAEAYWGLVLCKFGVEYVDDSNGKKIPTCHRTMPVSIMDDEDFALVCDYADLGAKSIYREEAKTIDRIQKKILEIAATEKPYDIFICYKETDDNTGLRTEDSAIAQDIYTELIKEGYNVFFSRVTLREVAGSEYEPYIYAALSSAKVMLAIGTKYEYYDAVWVKNEWSRFISMMIDDSSKTLIPCFRNIDAYDIPKEFKNMQALDMGNVTFFASLLANINRILSRVKTSVEEVVVVNNNSTNSVEPLLKRVFLFLEDGDFKSADEYCEKALDIDPENARAYLGKLMVDTRAKTLADLSDYKEPFGNYPNYKKIIRFGDDDLKSQVNACLFAVNKRIREQAERAEQMKKQQEKQKRELLEKQKALLEQQRVLSKQNKEQYKILLKQKRKLNDLISCRVSVDDSVLGGVIAVVLPDGTVRLTGKKSDMYYTSLWCDVIEVIANDFLVFGLSGGGNVYIAGRRDERYCGVPYWRNIATLSAGEHHLVGMKYDGTVVAVGYDMDGQCNVAKWEEIIAIAAGSNYTVGLKIDGTVVSTVLNREMKRCIAGWKDIVSISSGASHIVGLKSDGTVVATGRNNNGQCNVSDWMDIVAVSAGRGHTVGLKSDGTVVAVGKNFDGQCNVSAFKDIVAISADRDYTFALKADGSLCVAGKIKSYDFSSFRLFNNIKTVAQEIDSIKEKSSLMAQYRMNGLCQYCGGEFSGLVNKKCVNCGKTKDYAVGI